MKNICLNDHSKISLSITILLALILISISCTGCNPVQDGWARKYTSKKHGFTFLYPYMLVLKSEQVSNDAVTLHLGQKTGSDLEMVFTMITVPLSEQELASEAYRLFSSSLYTVESIDQKEIEEVSGHRVAILEASAGDKEKFLARSAAFAEGDQAFFITLIAPEEHYDSTVEYLYRIIDSIDVK